MSSAHASTLARVGAVARRDFAVEVSYHFQLMLRVFQMLFFVMTLFFVSKLIHDPTELQQYGGHYFEFVVTGVAVAAFATVGLGAFTRTLSDEQRAGTLEILLSTPTPVRTLLMGALIVPMGMTAIELVLVFAVAILVFGAHIPVSGALVSLPLLALTVATFCALGIFSASFIVLTKRGDPFTIIVASASTFLGGALFPTSVLPGPVEGLARAAPAFYGLRGMRDAILGGAGIADVGGDIAVLAAFTAVLLPIALLVLSRSLRAARITGTLGNY